MRQWVKLQDKNATFQGSRTVFYRSNDNNHYYLTLVAKIVGSDCHKH